jgi:hypothetical protein
MRPIVLEKWCKSAALGVTKVTRTACSSASFDRKRPEVTRLT